MAKNIMHNSEELPSEFEELPDSSGKAAALYQSLFADNRAIMLLIDPESGDIRDANAAASDYYGYSREAMRKMQIMAINTLSPEELRAEMDDAKLEKRHYFHFRHRLADGRIRDVEVFSGPIFINNEMLLYSIIHDISDRVRVEQEKELLIEEMKRAIKEIKTLQGILPICSSCKKIRDDKGYWQQLEAYLSVYSGTEFSHGICPDCAAKLYPDLVLSKKKKKKT